MASLIKGSIKNSSADSVTNKKTIKFALAGNPNCGKTTLFNKLTGSKQYVGNWPGVTVEKKEGIEKFYGKNISIS